MSNERLVEVEHHDAHAVVALNRPDKMNAVSVALADQFVDALRSVEDVPVVILTGRGRAFCAGVDLKERAANRIGWRSSFGAQRAQYWAETVDVMRRHPAVFIAAVNGFALGGGLTLVNNSELAIAAPEAEFGMPELGFGSFPALAGPTSVRRLLPKHVAEMVFVPQRVTAAKAHAWGLVNEVVDAVELLPRAHAIAQRIAQLDAVALAHTKRAIRHAEQMGWTDGIEYGAFVSSSIQAVRATHGADSSG